jgi:hypothetical protein
VSPVATDDTAPATGREWTRTHEQEVLVLQHEELVRQQYRDPRLRKLLLDETIWGTEDLVREFGLAGATRAFQWYTTGRELAEADQAPHPAGVPEADATKGKRGPRDVRGMTAGRARLWAWGAGKLHWDSIHGVFVRQEHINSGGAPQRYP